MKIKSLITALGLALSMLATAQDYCLTAPFGYGASTTGGAGGSVVTVKSSSELSSELGSSGKKIIIVTQDIQFTSLLKVKATDKTLLGLPGVKLYNNTVPTNASDAAAKTGILYFKENSKNVIIRNLIFQGSGAFDSESADGLCLDAVTNFWIDHCDFQDGVDGNFDIKNATDNITVTWCRFRYLKSPKSKSSWTADKGTDDHRYSNLVGSGSSDKPSNRRITYAYNWWDEGCVQRMPRARHSQFHLLNNYWSSSVASACLGLGGCTAYIEGCYFTQKKSVIYKDYSSDDGASNKLKFVDSYGAKDGLPSSVGTVSAPTYSYTALSYSETKTAVTNSTCGAGATLDVTEAGVVSSSCSSTIPTVKLSSASGTNAQTITIGNSITTITYTLGGTATGATVTGLPAGVTYSVNGTTVTISGTPTAEGTSTYTVTTTQSTGSAVTATGTIKVNAQGSQSGSGTSTFWNFSDTEFATLGTLKETKTVNGLKIYATANNSLLFEENAKSIDGIKFTTRAKTQGNSTYAQARSFEFAVTGPCSIDVYVMSASSTATDRTFSIASSASNVLLTQTVGTAINKYTYSYTGGAATLNIYSSNGAINFYGIRVTYATSSQPEAAPTLSAPNNASQTVTAGTAIQSIVYTASGTANNISVANLPAGLTSSKNGLTLTISGTPTASGTYTVTATNASGATKTATGTITVNPLAAPTLSSATNASQTVTAGTAIQNIVYTASGTANNISVANLPAGLTSSKNGLTLTISGTPTATGIYTVTVTNASGATKTATGTITVNAAPTTGVADAEKAEWTVTNNEVLYSADVQKISIYDFAGHNLLSGSLVSYLNISGLAAGNYIAVAILPNGKLASLKFNKK
ncbi:MAG: hypothetical protein IJJ78_04540 [Paludibacteraceae bacterium]|nr:hypothetical protein [Paludibacteraceae bacterium]